MAPNCENCKTKKCEDNAFVFQEKISLYTHESDMARMSKIIKGLLIIILVLIVLLVGTNIAWIAYESQFETVESTMEQIIEAEQDGEGVNIIGGGDVVYGAESASDYQENSKNQTP